MTILNLNSMQLLSFLYTDIMYYFPAFPALLRFSSMLWKTNAFCILLVRACKWLTFYLSDLNKNITHQDVDKILYVLNLKSLVVMTVQSKL